MRVLSNTSPLLNLAAIDHQDLLPRLFEEIITTPAVIAELRAGGSGAPAYDASRWPWLKVHRPTNIDAVRALSLQLDLGEAETLAAALEILGDLVLMDEKLGRRAAAALGLKPLGTVGVLLMAKQRGLLTHIKPALDALRERAGFWLSDGVFREALLAANESSNR